MVYDKDMRHSCLELAASMDRGTNRSTSDIITQAEKFYAFIIPATKSEIEKKKEEKWLI